MRSSGPLAVVVAAVLERRRANWRDVALVVAARRRSRCVRSGENKERCGGDEVEMRPKSFDKGTRGKSTRVLVGIDDHDEDVVAPMRPQRLSMSRSPQTGGNRARGARASTKVAPAAKTD